MHPQTRPASTPPASETKRRARREKKAAGGVSQPDPGPTRQGVEEARARPRTPSPVEYFLSTTPTPPLSPESDGAWSGGEPRAGSPPGQRYWRVEDPYHVPQEYSDDFVPSATNYSAWYDQPRREPLDSEATPPPLRDEPDAAQEDGPQLEADPEEREELERRWNEDLVVEQLRVELEETIAAHAHRREQWARARVQRASRSTSGDSWSEEGVPRSEATPRYPRPGPKVHWEEPLSTSPTSSPPWDGQFTHPLGESFPGSSPEWEPFLTVDERIWMDLPHEHVRRTDAMMAEARTIELQDARERQQAYERLVRRRYQDHEDYLAAREREERRQRDFSAAERQRKQDEREREKVRQRQRQREEEERGRKERETEEDKRRKAHAARAAYFTRWEELKAPPREATPTNATPPDPTPSPPIPPSVSPSSITFAYLVWPLLPPLPTPPSWPTVEDVTPAGVATFLLLDEAADASSRKRLIGKALNLFHPDKFGRLVARMEEAEGARAKEVGLRVSQVLTDLFA